MMAAIREGSVTQLEVSIFRGRATPEGYGATTRPLIQ